MRASIAFLFVGGLSASCFEFDFGLEPFPDLCFFDGGTCGANNEILDCNGEVIETCEGETFCREQSGLFGPFAECILPCGDGVLDAPEESCDADNSAGALAQIPEGCDPTSCQSQVPPSCGDGVSDGGEVCFQPFVQGGSFRGFVSELADLDNDGDLDAIDGLSLFFNDGNGVFSDPVDAGFLEVPGGVASSIRASDLDGDGLRDLFRVRDGNLLEIVFRRSDGSVELASSPLPQDTTDVRASDLNNDGAIDMIGSTLTFATETEDGSSKVYFLPGDGLGGFGTPQDVAVEDPAFFGLVPLSVDDIDNDGDLDIFLVRHPFLSLGEISLLNNQGDGTFVEEAFAPFEGVSVATFTTFDFDNDGALDIAAVTGGTGAGESLLIFQNDGFGQLTLAQQILQQVGDTVRAGDFDGDGAIDLAILGGNGAVYRNEAGVFSAPQYFAGFGSSHAVGDLNNDGKADVIVASGPNPVLVSGGN